MNRIAAITVVIFMALATYKFQPSVAQLPATPEQLELIQIEPEPIGPPLAAPLPPIQYQDKPGLLMDKATEDRLRKAMPENLAHLVPGVYYTGKEIPSAFQHSSFNQLGFHLSSHNFSGGDPVGNSNEWPWKFPGGTDRCEPAVYTWKILQLPMGTKVRVFDSRLFVYNQLNGGYYQPGLDWEFPIETRFVEVFSFGDRLAVFEVRTRHKQAGGWQTKRFAPFKSSGEYIQAGGKVLSTIRQTLTDTKHTTRPAFETTAAGVDTVDARRDLLARPFVESRWAPTAAADPAIVPRNYDGAFAAKDCRQCHAAAMEHVSKFTLFRDWYGHVRGSQTEKILSFHPVDPAVLSGNGFVYQPRLNPKLVDVVQWK